MIGIERLLFDICSLADAILGYLLGAILAIPVVVYFILFLGGAFIGKDFGPKDKID